jgi:ubiquinone/menaquinone biosynthesis C-methylase UbiE
MANSGQSFREFEQAGWEDSRVVAKYHEHLSGVTTQSVDALLDAAGVRNGSRVLDVATGAGYIAAAAALRGADTIGIDFSAAQVRTARERYPSVRFDQADAEALPFDPDTFDAVVNGFGMCHLSNPDIALREAFRVLRRGGCMAFTVWTRPNTQWVLEPYTQPFALTAQWTSAFRPVRTSFCSAIPSIASEHW